MKRLDMSLPAFVIAFILGPGLERSMRQTFLLDEAGGWIFLERSGRVRLLCIGSILHFSCVYYNDQNSLL